MDNTLLTAEDCLCIVREEMDEKTFRTIVKAALAQAMEGDRMARDWLSKYVLPEDPASVNTTEICKKVIFTFENLENVVER